MSAGLLPFRPSSDSGRRASPTAASVLAVVTVFALLLSLASRAFTGLQTSLWLDEAWTGAFASERSLGALTHQIRNDANAPLYYYFMFFWTKLFGVSNMALRAPSVLFSLATPIVGWFSLKDRWPKVALIWCSLLALWAPGVELSADARCYALLVFSATVNLWAFVRVLEAATLWRGVAWVASASITVLIHYHGAFLAIGEAAVFVALRPRQAVALWPAAFSAVPALGWIGYHLPRLAAFADPKVAWYDRLSLNALPGAVSFLVGSPKLMSLTAAMLLAAFIWGRRVPPTVRGADRTSNVLWAVCMASLLGAGLCLMAAMARPTFTERYLSPFAPGALLGLSCAMQQLGRGRWEPSAGLIAGFAIFIIIWAAQPGPKERLYSFERASAFIGQSRPDRLAFFWDHPATAVETKDQLDLVGGFFLRRAGRPIVVTPLYPRPDTDMSEAAVRAAGPNGAVLWLYDTSVHGTLAKTKPPRMAVLGAAFTCRNFGDGQIGVVACRKEMKT